MSNLRRTRAHRHARWQRPWRGPFGAACRGAVTVLLLTVPRTAIAQAAAMRDSATTASRPAGRCTYPVSTDQLANEVVDQRVTPVQAVTGFDGGIETIGTALAEHVRIALGGARDSMPFVDALGDPARVDGIVPVAIVLHRKQPPTWRADTSAAPMARLVALYAAALRDLSADAPHLDWPKNVTDDSVVLTVSLSAHLFGSTTGKLIRVERTPVAPVFWMKADSSADAPPIVKRSGRLIVPNDFLSSGIAESAVLEAVIRPDGSADESSIHDIPEAAAASDSSHFARYHKEFVDAVRTAIVQTEFFPARHGGCAVSALVRLPYQFGRMPK